MTKSNSKDDSKEIAQQISWIYEQPDYTKMNNQDIQDENKKILNTLKSIENKLDKELDYQRKNLNLQETQESNSSREKVVNESIKNNQNTIKMLEKQVKKLMQRRQDLKNGLEAKLNTKKYELEKRFSELKSELKKMKLQEKQLNKKLQRHQNSSQPQSLSSNMKLEQQLRVHSIIYMKQLQKYNRVTEQLALASSTAQPELVIPEEVYDQELEQRQEAQYKEYQGIVKLCTILSKRNDSEKNKYNRIYSEKLKELEKTIINLGQIDRSIALREGQIIEGKKNIELVKFKINNNEKFDDPFLPLSRSTLRRNSYSLSRLPLRSQRSSKQKFASAAISRKLSKR